MGVLVPLFFLGLVTLAVPVIIHMVQRERKEVTEFPSLMFIRKIPFHSFRRQRVRNWLLLILRCAAIALLLAAFARPFFRSAALASVTSTAREVVILIDRSYSMGYDDRWDRAKTAASDVVNQLGPDDRATVILFDSGAQAGSPSTTDRASLLGLIGEAELGSGSTRYGPALKLAEGIFEDSDFPHLEAVLVSDFQRSGLESALGVRFPEGTVMTPITVTSGEVATENVSVDGVLFDREYFSGRERVSVAARVTNRGMGAVDSLDVSLAIDGREIETLAIELPPNDSSTVSFAPVTIGDRPVAGTVRTRSDLLPTDDVFHFVVSPGQVVSVLIVVNERGESAGTLYLSRALGIGSSPAFDVTTTTVTNFDAGDLVGRQVVVLNGTRPPIGQAGVKLEQFVRDGGGLMVVAGERSDWSSDGPDLLPGTFGSPVDRTGRGAGLGFVDYSHPIFELFSTPRSGDITTARFLRYRLMEAAESATVLARFDDGNPALLERQLGSGRVLFWASTLDNFWNDLALKPVYLPFVHRLTEYLAEYTPPTPWVSAGQVLNLVKQRSLLAEVGLAEVELVAISPSGERIPISQGIRAGFLTTVEQGIYEIHGATTLSESPLALAVNVDLAESDLTAIDPDELASILTGRVAVDRGDAPADVQTRVLASEDLERRQGVWWYLLVVVFVLFVAETVISNRLSRIALNVD
jgi:hypothetical protein